MRYRKPFTPEQRRSAIASYRSWRNAIARIRDNFRPLNPQQWEKAREFRAAVREFARALRVVDAKVDVARINTLQDRANTLGVEYALLRNRPPDFPDHA